MPFSPIFKCISVTFTVNKHGQDGLEVVRHCEKMFTYFGLLIGKNCLSEKEQEDLLHLLRGIAYASTHSEYKKHFDSLLKSKIYMAHPRVRRYLQLKWLGCTTVSSDSSFVALLCSYANYLQGRSFITKI